MLITTGNDLCNVRRQHSFIISYYDSSSILLYKCIPLSTNSAKSQTVLHPGISPSIARISDFIYPHIKMPGSKTFFSSKKLYAHLFRRTDHKCSRSSNHIKLYYYIQFLNFSLAHTLCTIYPILILGNQAALQDLLGKNHLHNNINLFFLCFIHISKVVAAYVTVNTTRLSQNCFFFISVFVVGIIDIFSIEFNFFSHPSHNFAYISKI